MKRYSTYVLVLIMGISCLSVHVAPAMEKYKAPKTSLKPLAAAGALTLGTIALTYWKGDALGRLAWCGAKWAATQAKERGASLGIKAFHACKENPWGAAYLAGITGGVYLGWNVLTPIMHSVYARLGDSKHVKAQIEGLDKAIANARALAQEILQLRTYMQQAINKALQNKKNSQPNTPNLAIQELNSKIFTIDAVIFGKIKPDDKSNDAPKTPQLEACATEAWTFSDWLYGSLTGTFGAYEDSWQRFLQCSSIQQAAQVVRQSAEDVINTSQDAVVAQQRAKEFVDNAAVLLAAAEVFIQHCASTKRILENCGWMLRLNTK